MSGPLRKPASLPKGGSGPTPRQELLLRAALGSGAAVAAAWKAFSTELDLDHLDPSSIHLLPEVYKTLLREGVDVGPELGRLQGIARQCWYRNQIALRDAAELVARFAAVGIQVMLVGRTAVSLRYPDTGAARLIDDLGWLVRKADAERARHALREAGWQPQPSWPGAAPRFEHFIQDERAVDMHSRLLTEESVLESEDDLWGAAATVEWQGARALVLDPAHQLLHLCVHGVRWRPIPEVRWVADAAAVLDHAAMAVDWQRLVEAAARHHVSLRVRYGLACLRRLLGPVVSQEAIDKLGGCRPSMRERLEMYVLGRAPGRVLGGLPERGLRWLRLSHGRGWHARVTGFPAFLTEDLGCTSKAQTGYVLVSGAARRIAGRITRTNKDPWT